LRDFKFEIEIFSEKNNCDETVGIHDKDSESKGLNYSTRADVPHLYCFNGGW